jgi:hypothetical protein|tara:strand:- start:314 stop:574 length:261 start_codon:yes stop_codon:yes gene_type:complete
VRELQRGALIRWVEDYNIYAAYDDGLIGYDPTYRHGIVIEVANMDANKVAVYCYDCKTEGKWLILDLIIDELEILSEEPYDEKESE